MLPQGGIVVTVGRRMPPRWTPAEERELVWLWQVRPLEFIAQKLGRSVCGVHHRAWRLGLGLGRPRGAEAIEHAAARCGVSTKLMRRILEFAGVRQRLNQSTGKRPSVSGRRQRWVMPEEADRAMQAWMGTENITAAALSRGVSRAAIELRVRRYYADRAIQWGRETRVPTEVVEAICAELARTKRRGPPRRRA